MLFILPHKLFLYSRHLNFSLDILVRNALITTIRLILNFITSQFGKEIITIHILPNSSRSKPTKFGKLIKFNNRNIFFKKSYSYTRLYSIKSKLSISLDQKYYSVCFYGMPSSGLWKYIVTKLEIFVFNSYKAF